MGQPVENVSEQNRAFAFFCECKGSDFSATTKIFSRFFSYLLKISWFMPFSSSIKMSIFAVGYARKRKRNSASDGQIRRFIAHHRPLHRKPRTAVVHCVGGSQQACCPHHLPVATPVNGRLHSRHPPQHRQTPQASRCPHIL